MGTTQKKKATVNNGQHNASSKPPQMNSRRSISPAPKPPMVTIKWPKNGGAPRNDSQHQRAAWSETDIKYPLKWLINQHQTSKTQKQSHKDTNKQQKKKQRYFRSINPAKTTKSNKLSSQNRSKITLQPMSSIDHSSRRPPKHKHKQYPPHHERVSSNDSSISKKHSVSSVSHSESKSTRKRLKHFGRTEHAQEDMGSIDEIGALMHSSSSDTEEYVPRNTARNTAHSHQSSNAHHAKSVSSLITPIIDTPPPKSKSISRHSPLSYDNINDAVNTNHERMRSSPMSSRESNLSANIQHTNTKLFDTLRKLSSQQLHKKQASTDSERGMYQPIQTLDNGHHHRKSVEEEDEDRNRVQSNIMLDNSSDDSVADVQKPLKPKPISVRLHADCNPAKHGQRIERRQHVQSKSNTSLLTQSYTRHAGHAKTSSSDLARYDIAAPAAHGYGHNVQGSDTMNTLSSMTPTIHHQDTLFDVGCNVDD
eukprot:CAMPEP_0197035514 /NCGR_PEP_ID=MMETSP1384-20130603/13287_1 /TAXON_ID=29189 /ORGANISM="Ammonia sp." /LENGTH=478 /DNA_ID=CAMNT_0042465585 /DNA_START=15 /DNA_END=1451 /DNA_ORIENTATION=-